MRNWHHIILMILFLWSSFQGLAQSVDAVIDRDEILIGEQAVISLSVRLDKNNPQKVEFPVIGDTLVTHVEVVTIGSIDTLLTGEGVSESRLEQKLHITSFDSGYYAIPPFQFKVDGDLQETQAFLLSVQTVEIDTTAGIMPDRGIYDVEVSWLDYIKVYWPYAAGVAGVILAAAIIFLLIRRYRQKQKEKPAPVQVEPEIPPHIIALEELNRIGKEKIFLKGKIKEYHTQITDALREYIERAFNVQAHELTSRQILQNLKYSGIEPKDIQALKAILFKADMVKFAKEIPDDIENEKSLKQAILFVENTIELTLSEPEEPEETE
jgi:hypothetical protein